MVIVRYYYSILEQRVWGVNMRDPDDDHADYWLPEWITDNWPSDSRLGPDMPSDFSVNWKAEFHSDGTMTWIQAEPPPIGGDPNYLSEENGGQQNGSS